MKWPTVALGELSTTGAGQYGTSLPSREWHDGDPRYIRITDIRDDGSLNDGWVAPDGDRDNWENAVLRPGDLLFARSGATVGKAYLYPEKAPTAVYAGYLIRFPLDCSRILPRFAFHYTRTPEYRAWIASAQRAVAQPNINAKQFATLHIPLPPLDEQRRIAAILDHADELRNKRSRTAAMLDSLSASTFIDMFGDPLRNERHWGTERLGDLGEWHSGATPPRSKSEYFAGDIPWYSSGELGPLFSPTTKECVSRFALEETSLKQVQVGSLMLGMYDTAAFKSSIASEDCSCNQAIAFSKLDPSRADTIFVYFAVQLASSRLRQLQRGIRQKNLNLSIVRKIQVPSPPINLQVVFRKKVVETFEMRAQLEVTGRSLDELFASLQSRAFRGQL